MTQLSLDVPTQLQTWIDARVAEGDYSDAAEYLRDLIRRDRAAADRRWLKAMIDEGLASGVMNRDAVTVLDEVIAEDPDLRG